MNKKIYDSFDVASKLIKNSTSLSDQIEQAAVIIAECIKKNNKILLFGNGGSAADAQHIAAELVGRFSMERNAGAISVMTHV